MRDDESSADSSDDSLIAAVARIPARELDWRPPEELDEYRLLRPLGRGGMGSVWLAEDRLLDRLVAVKFIALAELDAHARERFAIEARAAARLQHTNVVTVYRFGEISGRPYIVSEYIRGEGLDRLGKPMPWQRVLELGISLARGLAAAHRHGIVHRDIKPANAILSSDGEVKLVDFGLAKLGETRRGSSPVIAGETRRDSARAIAGEARRDSAIAIAVGSAATLVQPSQKASGSLTATGAIAGTPLYLAPEVRAGEAATRRSDVYQLGCILYELVTAKAPALSLPGGPATDAEVPSLAAHVGADGAKLAAIVDRCLRRDPSERFASGDELREALERIAAPQLGGELPEGNPYRGLVAFEAEDRALFFGRGAEIRAVIERLRAESFVLVTGDSGVGKSSLCRAGVLPHIGAGALGDGLAWQIAKLVPGQRPATALASAIATHAGIDESALLAMVREQPAGVIRELRRALGKDRGLVVFIDQLEELATLAERDEADACAALLGVLASGTPGVRVLATVRGDFVTRVAEIASLENELARALYVLRPLSAEGARDAIVGPARAKGGRFESEELVDTLAAVAGTHEHVELPLLEFTLAQLWDARDPATQTITARSLDAIGGVRGALARHADGVIEALLPARRAAAKRVLLKLVTPERTRERKTAGELGTDASDVLDALVRGRLVVARGAEPPLFELAHERLIDGWPALGEWLSRTVETRAIHARLAAAASNWERLERAKEALWHERQLADVAQLAAEELTPSEAAFAEASQRAVRRRRRARIAIAIAVPALAASVYGGARLIAHRDLSRAVDDKVRGAERDLARARDARRDLEQLRAKAVIAFDTEQAAEPAWLAARRKQADTEGAYAQAASTLEAALLLDTARSDIRRELAEVTLERIQLADALYQTSDRDELTTRLALYDQSGALAKRPAFLELAIEPRDATIAITSEDPQLTATAGLVSSLAPGSYVLVAQAPGHAPVRAPFVAVADKTTRLAFALPPANAVPQGYIYVPPGDFLYGSRDVEQVRRFLGATPMHVRTTGGYLIGRTEVTYAQWIEFLDALPPREREIRAPHVESSQTIQNAGGVELHRDDRGWALQFVPSGDVVLTARVGEPIVYPARTTRQKQDWLRMPVSGITPEDAIAYAAWLDSTHRVPHARLCSEAEWERAARGADGRTYPHGRETLAPDDANIDVTYGQRDGAFGPDEVGAHLATTSPFGVVDASGNVWEIVRSSTGTLLLRGGAFYVNSFSAYLPNRGEFITPTFRHVLAGVRICADY